VSDLAERLQRVRTQMKAFRDLHAQELQLILDELADIAASAGERAPTGDASMSPKRAKWLAEEQERQQLSRRELFRGREREGPAGS
jgi:flagellar motor switch protein FliG